MTTNEMSKMADELSRKAANEMHKYIPENIEDIDMHSFAEGMRFCRAGVIETLKVTAEALRAMGKHEGAAAMLTTAKSMETFPIVGED